MTLTELIIGILTLMPACLMVNTLGSVGSGFLLYLLGVPLALALGIFATLLNWHLGNFFWQRSQRCSEKTLNAIAFALLVSQFVWIFIASICVLRLAHFLIKAKV
jgi:hypothetical protein